MDAAKINIQINFQQIVEAIKQLTPTEKLKINELIWEDDFAVPIEHQKIVLDRIEKIQHNPERLLDWDEVSKKL